MFSSSLILADIVTLIYWALPSPRTVLETASAPPGTALFPNTRGQFVFNINVKTVLIFLDGVVQYKTPVRSKKQERLVKAGFLIYTTYDIPEYLTFTLVNVGLAVLVLIFLVLVVLVVFLGVLHWAVVQSSPGY